MDSKPDTSASTQPKKDQGTYDKEFPPLGTKTQVEKSRVPNKSLPDKRDRPLSQKELKALSKKMRGRPKGPEGEEDNLDLLVPTIL
ncbi:hypothetical protein CEP54_016262 [Fusarium duplospermum]|uniref:Uncharacterized protein n=1 Tax=Fusarium duplospermum TaxID=1325734 RepID=A0A428NG66_9HYPO|nr:hypothetical protein CEP54_016262 [Fusarium duplospermum]